MMRESITRLRREISKLRLSAGKVDADKLLVIADEMTFQLDRVERKDDLRRVAQAFSGRGSP